MNTILSKITKDYNIIKNDYSGKSAEGIDAYIKSVIYTKIKDELAKPEYDGKSDDEILSLLNDPIKTTNHVISDNTTITKAQLYMIFADEFDTMMNFVNDNVIDGGAFKAWLYALSDVINIDDILFKAVLASLLKNGIITQDKIDYINSLKIIGLQTFDQPKIVFLFNGIPYAPNKITFEMIEESRRI